ncbi:MAG: AF1514 family protein [Betaproteobacteria bacterium]|nr:AF1514 family protein [Betaproteobacteria bacterium]
MTAEPPYCEPKPVSTADLTEIALRPEPTAADYREALALAGAEAAKRLAEPMLLSWYDRDRNFEAPQHVSECHQGSRLPGYVEYALYRGATLKVDVEDGRFVFFYRAAEL